MQTTNQMPDSTDHETPVLANPPLSWTPTTHSEVERDLFPSRRKVWTLLDA